MHSHQLLRLSSQLEGVTVTSTSTYELRAYDDLNTREFRYLYRRNRSTVLVRHFVLLYVLYNVLLILRSTVQKTASGTSAPRQVSTKYTVQVLNK